MAAAPRAGAATAASARGAGGGAGAAAAAGAGAADDDPPPPEVASDSCLGRFAAGSPSSMPSDCDGAADDIDAGKKEK